MDLLWESQNTYLRFACTTFTAHAQEISGASSRISFDKLDFVFLLVKYYSILLYAAVTFLRVRNLFVIKEGTSREAITLQHW